MDFEDIKCSVKVKDIHKIEKKNSISINIFGYENKKIYPIYISKSCYEDKHVDILLIGEKDKNLHVLMKDFNTFMYVYTLHCGKSFFDVVIYNLSVQKKY